MKIISLGWGVQSFTLGAMVALGELERVDAAIHADTLHESRLTYEFIARQTPWLNEHGVRIITVRNNNFNEIVINSRGGEICIPSYTNTPSARGGQLRRQCTQRWKIAPLRRWLQANRRGEQVEQWIGISLDEYQRMRDSNVKYIVNRYPLIERRMTRADCSAWLRDHDLEVPPKSACTFCPYHSTAEWRRIKATPEDWQEAVSIDRAIRKARPPYDLFVHSARIPPEDIDFRTDEERGQLSLWNFECSGMCGI